jgi:hypothetical protein
MVLNHGVNNPCLCFYKSVVEFPCISEMQSSLAYYGFSTYILNNRGEWITKKRRGTGFLTSNKLVHEKSLHQNCRFY